MRHRQVSKQVNKVRFVHTTPQMPTSKSGIATSRWRDAITLVAWGGGSDTVIEAKGAVTEQCFKNPMRGGCVNKSSRMNPRGSHAGLRGPYAEKGCQFDSVELNMVARNILDRLSINLASVA